MRKVIVSSVIVVTFILYAVLRENNNTVDVLPAEIPVASLPNPSTIHQNSSGLKDGEYIGISADAFYGYIQVKAVIKNGKLIDINFLQYPRGHENSIAINMMAMPYLKREAITVQSANVDIVSGATDTTKAFIESLSSALLKAQS